MSKPNPDVLWQKYLTACRMYGAKDERRQIAFDKWWHAERAELLEQWNKQKRKTRKAAAEAVR